MAKRSILLATSHNSFEILIFDAKCLHEIPTGSRGLMGHCVWVGRWKSVTFNKKLAISHTRTVVREWCKGDDDSLWGNRKFDPPLSLKTCLTDLHKDLRISHTYQPAKLFRMDKGFCLCACAVLRTLLSRLFFFFWIFQSPGAKNMHRFWCRKRRKWPILDSCFFTENREMTKLTATNVVKLYSEWTNRGWGIQKRNCFWTPYSPVMWFSACTLAVYAFLVVTYLSML